MSSLKKQKSEAVEEVEEESPISEEILEKLNGVSEDLDKVNGEADVKILAIEREYEQKRIPLYKKRNELFKSIDLFWQTTLMNYPGMRKHITDDDFEALSFCEEVFVEESPNAKSDYTITFRFKSSPFFSNTELVKKFHYNDDDGSSQITGTDIQWKKGYEPKEEGEAEAEEAGEGEGKSEKGKKRAAASDAAAPTRDYSFLLWISSTEELGPGETDTLGEAIHENIWTDPLQFFLNEPEDEDEDEDEDEGEEDEDEDENEDENEDDE